MYSILQIEFSLSTFESYFDFRNFGKNLLCRRLNLLHLPDGIGRLLMLTGLKGNAVPGMKSHSIFAIDSSKLQTKL